MKKVWINKCRPFVIDVEYFDGIEEVDVFCAADEPIDDDSVAMVPYDKYLALKSKYDDLKKRKKKKVKDV